MGYNVGHHIADVELDANGMDDGSKIRIVEHPAATGGDVWLVGGPEMRLALSGRVLQRNEL